MHQLSLCTILFCRFMRSLHSSSAPDFPCHPDLVDEDADGAIYVDEFLDKAGFLRGPASAALAECDLFKLTSDVRTYGK